MSKYKDFNIYFFNNFHNGDVFYSKEFARDIKNQLGKSHYYIHYNDQSILKDFDIEQIRKITPKNELSLAIKDNDLYINTWIGQAGGKYLKYNCSLKSNYLLYIDIFKALELKLKPINHYIPNVNFDKINKLNIDKNCILVCNNNVYSGQSDNFDFDPVIEIISDNYQDFKFIMTNGTKLNKNNVTTIKDILGYNMHNLLEISYISTQTNIIIGRGSGPYCFTHLKDNMLNPNKIFIVFTKFEDEGKWVPDSECEAKQYWFNEYNNYQKIIDSINSIMKNKK